MPSFDTPGLKRHSFNYRPVIFHGMDRHTRGQGLGIKHLGITFYRLGLKEEDRGHGHAKECPSKHISEVMFNCTRCIGAQTSVVPQASPMPTHRL